MNTPDESQPETTPPPKKPGWNWPHFVGGLLGWYAVNWASWGLVGGFSTGENIIGNLICLPVNLLVLLILAIIRQTRWVALGILAALAINFAISLLLGLQFNAICFIPFIIK